MTLTTQGFLGDVKLYYGATALNATITTSNVSLIRIPALNISADLSAELYLRQFLISFECPPWRDGPSKSAYRLLSLAVTPADGTRAFTLLDSSDLYYPITPCLTAGNFLQWIDGIPTCAPCPGGKDFSCSIASLNIRCW